MQIYWGLGVKGLNGDILQKDEEPEEQRKPSNEMNPRPVPWEDTEIASSKSGEWNPYG